jgi:SAM-dependent methyltransferase
MKKVELYRDLAYIYDYLYINKNYKEEAQKLKKIIKQYKTSSGNELLDIACGTGSHLKYLIKNFKCTGIDLNREMIEIAKKKIPDASFLEEDMVDFSLDMKFDVIICLFSSIGYVKTTEKLEKTINNFTDHLADGGVIIIEPWIAKENFDDGSPHLITYEDDNLKIARVNISKIHGNLSQLEMHYLIAERDKTVQHLVEEHELAFFSDELIIEYLEKMGLEGFCLKEGAISNRGLIIGKKNK